jgi:acyl carrier protein
MDPTIDQLKHLIADKLDVNIGYDEIGADVPLLEEGLKLDSLAFVKLITLIEESFGFEFAEGDLNMEVFASLRGLAELIDSRAKVAAA